MTAPGIAVVGMVGGEVFGRRARHALDTADLLVGSPRHLDHLKRRRADRLELTGPLPALLEHVAAARAAGQRVCVLASGDPGFFGIGRMVVDRFGDDAEVLPAPSSVSLAWAAIGMSWDDADVVSAHGRPLAEAVPLVARSPKVAVLTAPSQPPECLGSALLAAGCAHRRAVIVSRLGEADHAVVDTDLDGLATGRFDPMSVVLLIAEGTRRGTANDDGSPMNLSWGAGVDDFEHRDGMITKPEVRAVVLSKLDLGTARVLWDLGAGSGSVGIEAATIRPGLDVFAVERNAADAEHITRNSRAHGVDDAVHVVVGEAPAALDTLPEPDRVFVGGGGIEVVDTAWQRLPPGGLLVATFVVLDRAVGAAALLGDMVQLHVDRAVPIGGVGLRLEPTNPTFVCWGRR
jgi:precorrin-6Y C5,15-methyltransferase (decarboxylating)